MGAKLKFTLPVSPATKKNHGTIPISQIIAGAGVARILPSKQFTAMFKSCKPHLTKLRKDFETKGIAMPVTDPISISAQFYRKQRSGDWNGFTQALGDILQWQTSAKPDCANCGLPAGDHKRKFCPTGKAGGYQRPEGAKNTVTYKGIIANDAIIQHWDGTRLHVADRICPHERTSASVKCLGHCRQIGFEGRPRVDVLIEILPRDQGDQLTLVPEEEESEEMDVGSEEGASAE